MTIIEFLSGLRKLGVELQVNGDQLRVNAPKGVLTPTLRDQLAARKEEIIIFLKSAGLDNQTTTSNIPAYERDGYIPLSFSQERIWFLDQMEPGNAAFNIPAAIRMRGKLNLTSLEKALNEILARHEVLRTNFDTVEGQPVQIIAPQKTLSVMIKDLSKFASEDQLAEVRRLTDEESKRPFNLRTDLLVRVTVLILNEEVHILLMTMHHIVSDGWSITVFSREFTTLYNAFASDQLRPLPPLPIQYADFAQWQREWLQGERLNTQLAYWKRQLGGELPQLEMLLDKPRPPVQTYHGGRTDLKISAALHQSLKRLSQQEDATLFMTLLAAFKLLLCRHTGLEDIIVGSPIAGRNRAETENLIGIFLNTLALRTDLSGNPSFRELINRVKMVCMDAYTYQDIPFEKLLIELKPTRDLSRTPIFQVFFNMLNLDIRRDQLQGLTTEISYTSDVGSKFDLTIYVAEQSETINLKIIYNAALFTPERIHELLSQYHFLLSQIVENPDRKIVSYSLVTPETRLALPNPVLPLDASWHGAVHSRFSLNAGKYPNHIAVTDQLGSWTYQELDHRSNQLANFLLAQGLKAQRVVAIYGYRCAELTCAIMGTLKAGGAFLILDPAYPVARLHDYLDIANPQGFIQLEAAGKLSSELESWANTHAGTCRLMLPNRELTDQNTILGAYPITNPDLPILADDLAAISFTSGSTGKPKGVMGRHGPLSHFLPWQCEIFDLSQSDHFSMLSGLSHDPLQRDIFTALWAGASVHIPDPEEIGTPGWLNRWMQQKQITFSHFTPAMAQLLTESTLDGDTSKRQLPALRYAFFVGDKLTRHDVAQLGRLAPNVICINSYGSTETQRAVGYLTIDPRDTLRSIDEGQMGKAVIPVGQGMKDVQLLVLTKDRQLAGVGELGEIYVRSPHLAKGYLGDNKLTDEKFTTNPFTNISGDRLYKSGDLGRFLPDGTVEFLGRKDTQVKIRGFRIELGEIETVLSEYPAVHQTIIATWEIDDGDKRLVAYVVVKEQQTCQSSELREFLRDRLPAHMIPSNYVFLDMIPTTPNGKIDRGALPSPNEDQYGADHEKVKARDITEEKLVAIWESLLHAKAIGVKDNFFELGGHSLMAVHLFTRINQEFGVNLPMTTLFQEATIEHLAKVINGKAIPTTWSSLIAIEHHGDRPPFFCVHGVTGDVLWFHELAKSLAPDYPFYGLQARGLDGVQDPFSQIETMASHYIEEIRHLQPKGPYFLGGASFGGTVALEISQQLMSQGEEVALLAIFDHFPQNVTTDVPDGKFKTHLMAGYKILRNFPYWLREFLQLGPARMLLRLRRKLRLARKVTDQSNISSHEQFDAADLIDFAPELPAHRQRLISSHYQAMKMYYPKPYSGQVTLFQAMIRPLLNTYDPELGWQKLAPGQVSVHNISSSHEGMFKKTNVHHLAKALKACIDQASSQNDVPNL